MGDILLHEFSEFLGSAAWHEAQPQSAGVGNSLVLLAFLDRHPGAYLDGPNDRRLMVDAMPLAFCATAHQRLIDFDRMLGSDRVALRPHHTSTQLVEHLKRRLVAQQSKLALKLECGLAGCLRRYEVSTPEPYRQRRVAVLHDGICHERHVGLADAASQDDRCTLGEPIGVAAVPALRAGKPVRPPQVLKVFCARRFIGEYPLKLGKRRRKTAWVHAANLASGYRFGNQPDRQGKNKRSGKAQMGLSLIQKLYRVEQQAKNLSAEKRYQYRQQQAAPILDQLRTWLDQSLPKVPPSTLTGKALNYLHHEWPKLILYLQDGRLEIDNNLAENAIRPFVVGRKNWLFSNSVRGFALTLLELKPSIKTCVTAQTLDATVITKLYNARFRLSALRV